MPDHPTGQSLRFRVKLDGGADLGNWSKCDGLSVEYEIFEYKEGGENDGHHSCSGGERAAAESEKGSEHGPRFAADGAGAC